MLPVPVPVSNYRLPDPKVLARGTRPAGKDVDVERVGASLLAALTEHGVECRLIGTVSGPRVTRYELQLAPGTKVSRVSALRDDLAYALATTEMPFLADPHLVPSRQALDVRRKNILRRHRHAHPKHRLRKQRVRRSRTGPIDVRKADDKVVDMVIVG